MRDSGRPDAAFHYSNMSSLSSMTAASSTASLTLPTSSKEQEMLKPATAAVTLQQGPAPTSPSSPARKWEPGFYTGLQGRIKHFAPAWFAATMGTGITSAILHNLPYQFKGLNVIAIMFWVLNVVMFLTFLAMSVTRYIMYPSYFMKMLLHPASSLFLGTFAMGFATVANGVVFYCVDVFDKRSVWVKFAWALFWIDAAISVLIAIGVPFVMFTRHAGHGPTTMTAVWFLPVVAPIVAAAHGGIVAAVLPTKEALLTIGVSYMMLGLGLAPAMLLMALYFQRLAFHKLPPSAIIFSSFLPVGPCGQSAFALIQLATVLRKIGDQPGGTFGAPRFSSEQARLLVYTIYGTSFVCALFMLGLGVFWFTLAIAAVIKSWKQEKSLPFNLGWWALTFPVGTCAVAAIAAARELDSGALRGVAMFFSMWVVLAWLIVAPMTVKASWTGAAFVAPELAPPPAPASPAPPTDKV